MPQSITSLEELRLKRTSITLPCEAPPSYYQFTGHHFSSNCNISSTIFDGPRLAFQQSSDFLFSRKKIVDTADGLISVYFNMFRFLRYDNHSQIIQKADYRSVCWHGNGANSIIHHVSQERMLPWQSLVRTKQRALVLPNEFIIRFQLIEFIENISSVNHIFDVHCIANLAKTKLPLP